jgi:hypothetical protein
VVREKDSPQRHRGTEKRRKSFNSKGSKISKGPCMKKRERAAPGRGNQT